MKVFLLVIGLVTLTRGQYQQQYVPQGYVPVQYQPAPAFRNPGFPYNTAPAPVPAPQQQQQQPYYPQQQQYYYPQQQYYYPQQQYYYPQQQAPAPTTTPTPTTTTTPAPALDYSALFPTHAPLPTHPPAGALVPNAPTVKRRKDGTRVESRVFGISSGRSRSRSSGVSYRSQDSGSSSESGSQDYDYEEPDYGPVQPQSYGFNINDDSTNNKYGRVENLDQGGVAGSYKIALPDGRTQIVTYKADKDSGFVAEVTYEGEAKYPEDIYPREKDPYPTREPITFFNDNSSGRSRSRDDYTRDDYRRDDYRDGRRDDYRSEGGRRSEGRRRRPNYTA